MAEFKIGDKASLTTTGAEVEIVGGPHRTLGGRDSYLIRRENGNHMLTHGLEPIPPADPRVDVVAKALAAHNNDYAELAPSWLPDARAVLAALDAMEPAGIASFLDESDRQERDAMYPAKPVPLAVGDRIRILRDALSYARVTAGDVLRVRGVSDNTIETCRATGAYSWFFSKRDEGTGWERVAAPEAYTHDGVTYDLSATYRDSDGGEWWFNGKTDADGTPRMSLTNGDPYWQDKTLDDVARIAGPLTREG